MRVEISGHAVERYRDRVKPQMGPEQARTELEALVQLAGAPLTEAPWPLEPDDPPDGYLAIADGIALPVVKRGSRWIAVTTLTRGTVSEHTRARRNEKARVRRETRARRRKKHRERNGDKRARRNGGEW